MPAALLLACALSAADAAWVASLWNAWDALNSQLPTANSQVVRIVTFDSSCRWEFEGRTLVRSEAHEGTVGLPNGDEMPPVLTSFVATFGADDRPFLVISAPAIWRSQPNLQDEPDLDALLRSVFIHEMTHVLQMPVIGPLVGRLGERLPNPDELTDDVIQDTFGDDPEFRKAYERERDLLYEAAGEADPGRRATLIREAVAVMEARRARFFTGDQAFYRELEDAFLIMEGAANWAGYQATRQAGADAATALTLMRRGGRRWSQDEGLAVFLVLEAQGRAWRDQVFGTSLPPGIPALLTETDRRGTGP